MVRPLGVRTIGSALTLGDNRHLWLAVATVLAVVLALALTADAAVATEFAADPTGVGDVSSGP